MKREYAYRLAGHSDVKQLQILGLMAYGQFKPILSTENWETWEEGFNSDTNFSNLIDIGTCFVCEYENDIIGMAFLIPAGNPFLYFQEDWSYIRYVGVHPGHEGKGVGRILTQKCIDEATLKGESVIALHTSEFQDAARHVYEGLGFEKQREFSVYDKRYWIYTRLLDIS
ncbi:MAG: GNAT family N-acetyltransferase [Bacteroidota bacterium]